MSDQTVEVRIRTEDEAVGKRLCDWSVTALDRLIPLIENWGLHAGGEEFTSLSGQFVVDDTAAYFEVIAHRSDDA